LTNGSRRHIVKAFLRLDVRLQDFDAAAARAEEFPTAVGYVVGYLGAVAALPVLAHELPWRELPLGAASVLACVAAFRVYQHFVIGDALSPLRARAVMRRVDLGSVFLFLVSFFITRSLDSLGVDDHWTLFSVLALAALVGTLTMLRQAREIWFSSSFVSRQEL
jgi:predicted membrane channel-forming protein YqfA (hemolysin III family)